MGNLTLFLALIFVEIDWILFTFFQIQHLISAFRLQINLFEMTQML